MKLLYAICPCLLVGRASSISIDLPQPTGYVLDDHDPQGWTPKPTDSPSLQLGVMHKNDLFRRQSDGPLLGYQDGNSATALNCFTGEQPKFFKTPNYFTCCSTSSGYFVAGDPNCAAATTCLNYQASGNPLGSTASDKVLTSSSMLCWPGRPNCLTFLLYDQSSSSSWSWLGCNTVARVINFNQVATTSVGNGLIIDLTEALPTQPTTTSSTVTVSTVSSANVASTSSVTAGSTGTPQASSPTVNSGSSAISGAAAGTVSPTPAPPSPSTNVGAIAGGTIGGVAAIVLAGGIIWFLARRKQREREKALPEVSYSGGSVMS